MEKENDVKSKVVSTSRSDPPVETTDETEALHRWHLLDEGISSQCIGEAPGHPSFRSVMDDLTSRGIVPFITDYSGCRQVGDSRDNGTENKKRFYIGPIDEGVEERNDFWFGKTTESKRKLFGLSFVQEYD